MVKLGSLFDDNRANSKNERRKMMIKDSGHRKQFESGAVRDARPGVGVVTFYH